MVMAIGTLIVWMAAETQIANWKLLGSGISRVLPAA
jgi:hypothetical protein